jgi:hypothetical protein
MTWRVGLWGPSASGKTAFLSQLCGHIPKSGWEIFPNEEGKVFLETAAAETAQNRFPPATPVGSRAKVVYDLKSPAGLQASISLIDRAGEEIDLLTAETTTELGDNDALLVLFDAMQDRQDLRNGLQRVLNSLHMAAGRGAGLNPTPLAICLTKVDRLLLTRRDLDQAQNEPLNFVRGRIDSGLEDIAKARLACFQFFPVSAAGVFVHQDLIRTATFYDETLALRLLSGGLPVNLTAPIEWLIDRREEMEAFA